MSRDEGAPVAIGRRVFLGMAGLGVLGIVFGSKAQRVVGDALSPLTGGGGGLASILPGADGFRIYSVSSSLPSISTSQYRLRVEGLVDRPMVLTFPDLQGMPHTQLARDFQCVTGWRVPDVHWAGVRLSEILRAAGVQPGAKALTFESYDGTDFESLTLDQAARPDVIVADRMLGGPVTSEHGGPVRLYVAPMYGYKSLKWLSAIRVVDRVEPGFWEENGYDVDAWVGNSNGRSDAQTS
ncbi:MAG TPA: molybdopterin-dependent oxidoreductase [Acidimicrobiales bacterium]|nr:molybdopterin-dependent oxidoreductase [Acidimicrobiales bacterium]